ncbi:MAG: PHP domain-containing protein [Methanomassiliicoccales archaeon]|jgi:predicted metal-dependent phosphoesterase TrpH
MKGDFHIHSHYSSDSLTDVRTILKVSKKLGLDAISVTDHESIRGSLEAKGMAKEFGIEIVSGMEINTDKGDILALQIGEEVQERVWDEVIDNVRAQGGITVMPHPFRGHRDVYLISERVDLIEVHNGRGRPEENRRALELAKGLKKPVLAGSDAHFWTELGNSINEYDDLRKGATSWVGKTSSPAVSLFSKVVKDIRVGDPQLIPYHFSKFLRIR